MTKRRKNKRWIYIVVMLILLAVAGGVSFAVWNSYFNDTNKGQSDNDENVSEIEVKKDDSTKEEKTIEKDGDIEPEKEKEKEEVMTYEGENPNNKEELTGVITYAGANDGTLVIRMNIDQYITSGNCELGLYRNGEIVYSDVAGISAAASTATCEGFNVPVDSVGGSGKYQIVINVKSGDKAGVIKGEVEI